MRRCGRSLTIASDPRRDRTIGLQSAAGQAIVYVRCYVRGGAFAFAWPMKKRIISRLASGPRASV